LDYHYAFTAAIVLQLGRLIPDIYHVDDAEVIRSLTQYLCTAGDEGNESARDCAKMVIELGAIVSRLDSNGRSQTTVNETSSSDITNSTIAPPPESMVYVQGQDLLFNSGEDLPGEGSFLGLRSLQQNESEVYQELFSWFQDAIF
jgi:hypothetical protein